MTAVSWPHQTARSTVSSSGPCFVALLPTDIIATHDGTLRAVQTIRTTLLEEGALLNEGVLVCNVPAAVTLVRATTLVK